MRARSENHAAPLPHKNYFQADSAMGDPGKYDLRSSTRADYGRIYRHNYTRGRLFQLQAPKLCENLKYIFFIPSRSHLSKIMAVVAGMILDKESLTIGWENGELA